jgi:hypothetical protein
MEHMPPSLVTWTWLGETCFALELKSVLELELELELELALALELEMQFELALELN